MRIRGRLVAAFLACGLIPMLAISTINLWNSRHASHEIGRHASEDLQVKTEQQLAAVRDLKKSEVIDYFGMIRDQVVSLSEDVAIVDAMREFSTAFQSVLDERELSHEDTEKLRRELSDYYERSFSNEYQEQNGGKEADALRRLSQLDGAAVTMQHSYIISNSNSLGSKHLMDAAATGTEYDKLHAKYHPSIRGFLDRFGYYDIFLIDAQTGSVVYSVFKELDFATNLLDGPYAKTNFSRAFREARRVTSADEAVLVDFECYWPSYEAPASFIASPIVDGDKTIGVLVFQMPVDRINELMSRDAGIGETGETLLIGKDKLQRCNSSRDPEKYSIVNAFRNGSVNEIRSDSVDKALAGITGVERTTNYLGEEVLSAFAPVELLGLQWGIVSEVTTTEAFVTVAEMTEVTTAIQRSMMFYGALAAILATAAVVAVGLLITRSLIRPIDATVETLRNIADGEGDLTRRLDENQIGELGDLARYFNRFTQRIHDIVHSIANNAATLSATSSQVSDSASHLSAGATQSKTQSATVSSAAEELSINMKNIAHSTEEMSSSIGSVSKAVGEMKATISEIAQNAERSAAVANQAAVAAEVSNARVGDMGSAANEIGKVIEVIQDIAEQTNLLALNATIEAARAGEAGKGFAVVATEVKELAKQTAAATDDIRSRIEVMQGSTVQAVESIEQISDVIGSVNELSRMIASAVEEQSITTQQIAEHISSTANLAQSVSRGVAESAEASREITENISHVDGVLQETAKGADESLASGDELFRLASEMKELVDRFRVDEASIAVS
ncbi:methyl-accepting chemotaxis protein [Stieleria varia]|uniref:Methyl-accepting chemotaxis protein PctB n=1 Tax=Stieleria varia TaxID=2528005 RepID=A0A5C6B339_9BACT|nr:methyl-accepting chemotaxis protein [Stieleria varia]TWU06310.1 Methyl-accepting chemotaxis protein PctB [Stieleria varia]